jgi:hypothetical protein
MSTSRILPAAAAVAGGLYVIGGRSSFSDEYSDLSSVEVYDPSSNTWLSLKSMPTARTGPAAAVLDGQIFAIGGNTGRQFLSVVEKFYPPVVDCAARPPILSALISAKSGTQDARKWTVTLSNGTSCPADKAQIDGLKLIQSFGVACTPVVSSPATFPLGMGDIAAHDKASGVITINFSACPSTARFTAKITYSANDGAVKGSKTLNNQFR